MKYLVFAGVIINLLFTFSYIKGVVKGTVQPNRISWLMWSIAPMIATVAAVSNGVGLAVIPVFMSGFTPFLIFCLSFVNKEAYWQLSLTDYVCGAVSILALLAWYFTKEPNYAIVFSLISDGFAALPTVYKSWHQPESEEVRAYIGGFILAISSFFAITDWNFSSLAFPIYLVGLNIVIILALTRKKWQF